ncbi:MAG: LAGLIDADG family homing endonuclease [bacterium]|nr:LAGLIDADG family homing endonuclease [bacterium]
MEPWYVAGFVDGEGSFHIALYEDPRMKTGWKAIPEFHVSQRQSSRSVLDDLVDFFGCGYVKANHAKNPKDVTFVYVVRNRDDLLTKIIPFFKRHPLETEKSADFGWFAKVVQMMANDMHLTKSGMERIIAAAYRMNGAGRYRRRATMTVT